MLRNFEQRLATVKKQTYLQFYFIGRFKQVFKVFRVYMSKHGQILEIFEKIDFALSVAKKYPN